VIKDQRSLSNFFFLIICPPAKLNSNPRPH
jgi:hypothetical protein